VWNSAAQLVKMIRGERRGERRDLCPRRSRGSRLLHRASAAKRSVPRALFALSHRLGIYGVVLLTDTSKHVSLNVASAVLLILSGLASIGFGVIAGEQSSSSCEAASLGARLLDDDRSGLGQPSSHSHCADRCRRCYRSKARCVAHVYPAHFGDHVCRADARRTTPRQSGRDSHRTCSKKARSSRRRQT
jgi:hypothetical protein